MFAKFKPHHYNTLGFDCLIWSYAFFFQLQLIVVVGAYLNAAEVASGDWLFLNAIATSRRTVCIVPICKYVVFDNTQFCVIVIHTYKNCQFLILYGLVVLCALCVVCVRLRVCVIIYVPA